jgi:hypothetical protein
MAYYRKKRKSYKKNKGHEAAIQHIIARQCLSRKMGGIDKDVEEIFFNLPQCKLTELLTEYGKKFGEVSEMYARETFSLWKHKKVKMSGLVAERLLNLIPDKLEPSERYGLIKKLRLAHIKKRNRIINCSIINWENTLQNAINVLLRDARLFEFPEEVIKCAKWLSKGDAILAQALMKEADEEEALVYASFIKNEFNKIRLMADNTKHLSMITRCIELPQGNITVVIKPPKKGILQWLFG